MKKNLFTFLIVCSFQNISFSQCEKFIVNSMLNTETIGVKSSFEGMNELYNSPFINYFHLTSFARGFIGPILKSKLEGFGFQDRNWGNYKKKCGNDWYTFQFSNERKEDYNRDVIFETNVKAKYEQIKQEFIKSEEYVVEISAPMQKYSDAIESFNIVRKNNTDIIVGKIYKKKPYDENDNFVFVIKIIGGR